MYLDTHVRWSHDFFVLSEVPGIRFVSVIVCIIFCFSLISSRGNFPLQSYWSLSYDHGLHCSDEFMWEQRSSPTRGLYSRSSQSWRVWISYVLDQPWNTYSYCLNNAPGIRYNVLLYTEITDASSRCSNNAGVHIPIPHMRVPSTKIPGMYYEYTYRYW